MNVTQRETSRWTFFVGWAWLAAGAAGCGGSVGRIHAARPRIRIKGVRLVKATPKSVVLRLHMRVKNRFNVQIPPGELHYTVWLAGVRLSSGKVRLVRPLPPRARVPITTTLRFGPLDAAKVAAKMAIGYRRYRVRATLYVQTPVGRVALRVDKKGKLKATSMLKRGTRTIKKRLF
jgi:LEA14-like dessication related protein